LKRHLLLTVDIYSTLFTFFVHIFYALVLFLTGVLFSRYLGVTAFGIYDYAEGVTEVFLAFCLFGFDRQLISRIASLRKNKQWSRLRGLIIFSRRVTITVSLVAGLVIVFLVALGLNFSKIEDNDDILRYFRYTMFITALIIPIRVYLRNDQAIMHGLQRVATSHLPDFIIRPAILLCGALLLRNVLLMDLTPPGVMFINLGGAIISLVVSTIFLKKVMPVEILVSEPSFIEKSKWIRSSIPLLLLTGATILSIRIGTIILGWIAGFEQVAQYGILMRIALVVNLIPLAINKVLAPKLSIAYSVNDKKQLKQLVSTSIITCFLFSIFVGGVIFIFEKSILNLFGESYANRDMIIALRLFIISNIMLAPFGVLVWLLIMTNHNWQASFSFVFPVIVAPFLFSIFVPIFSIAGAILAYIMITVIRFFLTTFFVKKLQLLT